jgi:hypothetical protein
MDTDSAVAALNVAVDWATRVDNALGQIQSEKLKQLANKQFSIELIDKPKELE